MGRTRAKDSFGKATHYRKFISRTAPDMNSMKYPVSGSTSLNLSKVKSVANNPVMTRHSISVSQTSLCVSMAR